MITLIFFVLIATIYISAAFVVLMVNSEAARTTQEGILASRIAEGALEDSLLRLLRDQNYAGGTFTLDGETVTVNVTGVATKVVVATATKGSFFRKFQADVQFNQNQMTITSWKEIF